MINILVDLVDMPDKNSLITIKILKNVLETFVNRD